MTPFRSLALLLTLAAAASSLRAEESPEAPLRPRVPGTLRLHVRERQETPPASEETPPAAPDVLTPEEQALGEGLEPQAGCSQGGGAAALGGVFLLVALVSIERRRAQARRHEREASRISVG